MAITQTTAVSGVRTSYSVQKLDSTSIDILYTTFRWFISGQATDELGSISGSANKADVTVIWKPVALGQENVARYLNCEMITTNGADVVTCSQIITIQVLVTNVTNDLAVTSIDGAYGSTSGYTGYTASVYTAVSGPLRLTDQCQILGNTMQFKAIGSSGTTKFWWNIQSPRGAENGGGVFIDDAGISKGSQISTPVAVDYSATTKAKWSMIPPVGPDRAYFVKVEASDNTNKIPTSKYLSFKLCATNPQIQTNYVPTTISENEPPLYFSWNLNDIHSYPEWFQFKALLEVGQLACSGPTCLGLTNSDFGGTYWQSGTMVEVVNKPFSEIASGLPILPGNYTFGYTVPLPSWFNTNWHIGDPDKFRVKLHTYFWDPDLNPSGTGPCLVTKSLTEQDVIMQYCPNQLPLNSPEFKGPTCPGSLPDPGALKWQKVPVAGPIYAPCATGYTASSYGSSTCTAVLGATLGPCVPYEGWGTWGPMPFWNGQTCIAPAGFIFGASGCYTAPSCPTGSTMVNGSCTCVGTGLIMDQYSLSCTCNQAVPNNPCATAITIMPGTFIADPCIYVQEWTIEPPTTTPKPCQGWEWRYDPVTRIWTDVIKTRDYIYYTSANSAGYVLVGDENFVWFNPGSSTFVKFDLFGTPSAVVGALPTLSPMGKLYKASGMIGSISA